MSRNPPDRAQFVLPRLLHRLWRHLSRRRKQQFGLLLVLTLASAIAEVVSLGAVIPFLNVLIAPDRTLSIPIVDRVAQSWGINSDTDLMLALTLMFVAAALVAGALRLLLLWASTKVTFASVADFSIDVYRRTLYQPYRVHISRNSSEIITSISSKVNSAGTMLTQTMTLISAGILLIAIMLALLVINAAVATIAAIGFGIGYCAITWLVRKRLEHNSQLIARDSTQVIKALQEGLGAIRDVLLDNNQPLYCEIYHRADQPLRIAVANNIFIGGSPRFVMEALGMTLIALLAYGLSRETSDAASILPALGALALGAQRVLPAMQQSYLAWVNIASSRASLADTLELLDQPLPADALLQPPPPMRFQDSIQFDAVSYRYSSDGPWVIDNVNLSISKGARVGIVGSTGSGKSTLLDLLMALMEPAKGQIMVDGRPVDSNCRRAWQRNIAHVPQSIYLGDTSFAENIAFGVPRDKIDFERVREAARQARIAEFIESCVEGYNQFVGERGIRISGGERQRIGIARALYKQATVLIFDEATSALDNATEQEVMEAIEGLHRDLTIVLVAHRLSTVTRCDNIFELENGKLVAQGTYSFLLNSSPSFRHIAEKE